MCVCVCVCVRVRVRVRVRVCSYEFHSLTVMWPCIVTNFL